GADEEGEDPEDDHWRATPYLPVWVPSSLVADAGECLVTAKATMPSPMPTTASPGLNTPPSQPGIATQSASQGSRVLESMIVYWPCWPISASRPAADWTTGIRKSFAAITMRFIVEPMLTSQIPRSRSTL